MSVSTTIDSTLGVVSSVDAAGSATASSFTVSAGLNLASTSVTAAAGGQSGATALSAGSALYLVAGSGGVRLSATPTVGDVVVVINTTGSAINVYPATGGAVGVGAANAALSVAARNVGTTQGACLLVCASAASLATRWVSFVVA